MSCIITLSVSSSVRLLAGIALSARTPRTSSMNSGRCSWQAETLTAIDSGGVRGHSRCICAAHVQASLEDVAPDRDDQAGVLEQSDEVERLHRSARGVLPAHERLHPCHVAAREVHDRLVAQRELAGVEAALQIALQLQARERPGVHLGLEDLVVALAVLLGDVHRRIGVAQQLVGVAAGELIGGAEGDADARRDRELAAVERGPTARASRRRGGRSRSPAARSRLRGSGSRTRRRRAARRCRPAACSPRAAVRPPAAPRSPAPWPRLSLTFLKSSMSSNSTATGSWSRRWLRAHARRG